METPVKKCLLALSFCLITTSTFAAQAPWYKDSDSSSDEEETTRKVVVKKVVAPTKQVAPLFRECDFFWKSSKQTTLPVIDPAHPLLQKTFSELQASLASLKQELDSVGMEITPCFTSDMDDLEKAIVVKTERLQELEKHEAAQKRQGNAEVVFKIQDEIRRVKRSITEDLNEQERIELKERALKSLIHVPLHVSVMSKTMQKCRHFFREDTAKDILIYYKDALLDRGVFHFQTSRAESTRKKLETLPDEKTKKELEEKLQELLDQKNLQGLDTLLLSLRPQSSTTAAQKKLAKKASGKKIHFAYLPDSPEARPLEEILTFKKDDCSRAAKNRDNDLDLSWLS